MRRWLTIALPFSLFLAACDDGDDPTPVEDNTPRAGQSSHEDGWGYFPSDAFTVEDPTTFTGRRVSVDFSQDPEVHASSAMIRHSQQFLNQLDGFGTSAGGWIRFSEDVDRSSVVDSENAFIGFFDGDTPTILDTEARGDRDMIAFRPDYPIPPNREAFFFTTSGITTTEGELFAATADFQAIVKGERGDAASDYERRVQETAERLVAAEIINDVDELTALSVFTTQSIFETDREIAEQIRAFVPTVIPRDTPCEDLPQDNVRRCYFDLEVRNFTGDDGVIADDAATMDDTYVIQVTAFLPRLEDAPYDIDVEDGYPVAVFGHGLTSRPTQGVQVAKYTAPHGIATIGTDSPQHGEHPQRRNLEGEALDIFFDLFGVEVTGATVLINLHALRDGWRQSAFDKLAVIEAIKNGIDVDGDGTIDLDASRISYLGASLGAMQGSELLALTHDVDLALFTVGGARITDLIRHSTLFGLLKPMIFPQMSQAVTLRTLIVMQMALERGDGINWAPHVMQNRLEGEKIPDFAMHVSIPDAIVPPETGINLTRALGLPIIGTPIMPARGIAIDEAPVKNNHASGRTAGVLQMDWMHRDGNPEWIRSEHELSPDSDEAITYWRHAMLSTYVDGDTELIDPYALPEAPPRPTE